MATNNNEFFDALAALEKERGLPADYLIDKIKAAIVIAVKKDYEVEDDNVVVDIDPNIGAFRASLLQDIVEEVENPHTQVSLEDAQKIRKTYKVGQRLRYRLHPCRGCRPCFRLCLPCESSLGREFLGQE